MCFFVLALCVNSRDDTGLLYYPQWCYPHPASPPPLSLEPVSLAGISATKLDVPCPSARPPVFSVRECKDMRQALCATGMRITGIFSQILFLIQWRLRMLSITFSLSFFISFIMGGGGSSQMCTPPLHAPIAAASFTGCPSVVRVGETETH